MYVSIVPLTPSIPRLLRSLRTTLTHLYSSHGGRTCRRSGPRREPGRQQHVFCSIRRSWRSGPNICSSFPIRSFRSPRYQFFQAAQSLGLRVRMSISGWPTRRNTGTRTTKVPSNGPFSVPMKISSQACRTDLFRPRFQYLMVSVSRS
jgi:hypothetical protein